MPTRIALFVLLGLALGGGAVFFLLREPGGEAAPAQTTQSADAESQPDARLEGVQDAAPEDVFREADVATTLGAFRFQPPNVPAAAVARLRHLVEADPELLEHLVRVVLDGEPLRADLEPPDYPYESKQAAQWALEALGRPVAVILAVRLATEGDPRMRRALYWLLGRLGAEAAPAVGVLVDRMRDASLEVRERGKAIHVLWAIGGEARHAAPDLLALLRDPDDDAFGYALNAIYRVAGMTDAVRDAFVDLLAIEDSDLRVDVLQTVVDQMGKDVEPLRPTLVGLVEHGGPDVRRMSLWALRPVGVRSPAAVVLVGRLVEDGDEDEEAAALAVLLASGGAGRATLLEVAQRTELIPLALRIGRGLSKDGAADDLPTSTLLYLFQQCDPHALNDVVALIIDRPGCLEAESALPVLRAEMQDLESDRRWAAVEALSAVRGDDEAVLALLQGALEDGAVRDFAFDALGRLARLDEQVVPILEAQAFARRWGAVNQLGTLTPQSTLARAALRRLVDAEDEELRDFAARVSAEVAAAGTGD